MYTCTRTRTLTHMRTQMDMVFEYQTHSHIVYNWFLFIYLSMLIINQSLRWHLCMDRIQIDLNGHHPKIWFLSIKIENKWKQMWNGRAEVLEHLGRSFAFDRELEFSRINLCNFPLRSPGGIEQFPRNGVHHEAHLMQFRKEMLQTYA